MSSCKLNYICFQLATSKMKNEEKNLLYDYNEIVKWKNAIERDIRMFKEQIQSMSSSNGVIERKHKEEERKKKLADDLQMKTFQN